MKIRTRLNLAEQEAAAGGKLERKGGRCVWLPPVSAFCLREFRGVNPWATTLAFHRSQYSTLKGGSAPLALDFMATAFLPHSNTNGTVNRVFQVDITELCPSATVLAQQLTHVELERLSYIGPEEFVQAFAKVCIICVCLLFYSCHVLDDCTLFCFLFLLGSKT